MYAKGTKDYCSLKYQKVFSVNSYTSRVAVPNTGEIFAACSNGNVQVFNNDLGLMVHTIGSNGKGEGQFKSSYGLLLVRDVLYVTDNLAHYVQYFSATTGEYLGGKFGSYGSKDGQFSNLQGITYDSKGNIIAADYHNKRIQWFRSDGTFIKSIQCSGSPSDVAIDNDNYIHATMYNEHIV